MRRDVANRDASADGRVLRPGKSFSGGSRSLPAIVATLPGDEAQFSRELDDRIRDRFPVGTSEDALLEFLVREDFAPNGVGVMTPTPARSFGTA